MANYLKAMIIILIKIVIEINIKYIFDNCFSYECN